MRRPQRYRAKTGALAAGILGIGLAAWLLQKYGVGRILGLLSTAGAGGVGALVALHLVQIVCSAVAWGAITPPALRRPSFAGFVVLRWVREGVNNLLPVAQIGGQVAGVQLLRRGGMKLAPAIAGTIADLTIEMVTQIAFTLMGLGLLLQMGHGDGLSGAVMSGVLVAGLLAAALVGAQWFGVAAIAERGLVRLGQSFGWTGTDPIQGVQPALLTCYRRPRALTLAIIGHGASWLLGGGEVCLALHFLGHDVGPGAGLVIESLGQALKSVGFAVPGALGVQEGGYILICHVFGLAPEFAIALSLMKRLREMVLGVPSLVAWQVLASRPLAARLPARELQ